MTLPTAYPWCYSHSTSISACGVWGVRAKVQVSRMEFHTYIHLDLARVDFYLVKKKKKKKKNQHDTPMWEGGYI